MASPLLYAHRGASLELPENTLEAFRLAIELGANAIETDAHMTRDGRIVLSHDPSGRRMAGVPRAIRTSTLEEVRTWNVGALHPRTPATSCYRMPTLDEVLESFPGVFFNVDAKQESADMIPALLRVIRRAGAADRVRIASFSARNLRRARELGYEGPTGLAPSELARVMLAPRALLSRSRRIGMRVAGDAAQVPTRAWGFTFASQAAIDRLHGLGLRVDFWTIDDPAEAERLLALGADGIMTDDIRRVAGALRGA
ncbi:MAG: glycerophosphodiester phosphodiesterase [Deltaproteobacteria bacterium]|nr:glycerophosphodiester phosphodiesterase [Deltaproteobacteria bacterium]